MKRILIAAALLAFTLPALAQSVPPDTRDPPAAVGRVAAAQVPAVDPRLSAPTIAALQAMLQLREAEIRALMDDARFKLAQREKDWAEYAKPLYAPPPAPATSPAPPGAKK